MIFYVGLNPRWQSFPWLPAGLNVMYSAAGAWEAYAASGSKPRKFPANSGLRFMDCGGFTMLNRYEDYPFDVWWYLNLAARTRPHYYATMDYPCEPEISRGLLATNKQRIQATVENARCILGNSPMAAPSVPVPVIQGYTLDEYLYCLRLHHEAGTIRPYMAVGSMCNRSNDEELMRLVPAISRAAEDYGVWQLHFFGLKLSGATMGLEQHIYSRDSAATYFAPTAELKAEWGGMFPRTSAQKRQAFESLFDRADNMELVYSHKHQLACPHCDYVRLVPLEEEDGWLCPACGKVAKRIEV